MLLGNELMALLPWDNTAFPGRSGTSHVQKVHFYSKLFAALLSRSAPQAGASFGGMGAHMAGA